MFDGQNYGWLPLISPYGSHARAAGTPRVLSGALRAAYLTARKHSRLIGVQTHATNLRDLGNYNEINWSTNTTDWVDQALFSDVLIPFSATHVCARLRFRMPRTAAATVRVRVSVELGFIATDTGSTSELEVSAIEELPQPIYSLDAPNDPRNFVIDCEVALTSNTLVTGTITAERTVRVSAYAMNDGDDTAQSYVPRCETAWWETRG